MSADDFLDHVTSRRFRWHGDPATHSYFLRHSTCGDEVHLRLQVVESIILMAQFEGRGCTISQAAASMLCEAIEGGSIERAARLSADDMLALIGITLTPMRRRCGLLAFEALQKLLATIDETHVQPK